MFTRKMTDKFDMKDILKDALIRQDLLKCVNKTATPLTDAQTKACLMEKLVTKILPLKDYPETIRTWADPNAGETFALVSFWLGEEATLLKVRGVGSVVELTALAEKLIREVDSQSTYVIIEMGVWKLVCEKPDLHTNNRKRIIDDMRPEAHVIENTLDRSDQTDAKIQHDLNERARKLKCESLCATPTMDTFIIKQIALMENEKQINLASKAVNLLTRRKQLLSAYIKIMARDDKTLENWFPYYMDCISKIGVTTPAINDDIVAGLLDATEEDLEKEFEQVKAELAKIEYDYGVLRI